MTSNSYNFYGITNKNNTNSSKQSHTSNIQASLKSKAKPYKFTESEDEVCETVNSKSNNALRKILMNNNELVAKEVSYCITESRENFDRETFRQKANKKININNYIQNND